MSTTMPNEKPNKILRKMYGNVCTADVRFTFTSDGESHLQSDGQQVCIPAHRSVLAAGSPVFYKMFFGDLRDVGDVCIKDVAAESFSVFLQFFYLDEVTLTNECIAQVIYLSDKYDVQDAIEKCEQFLEKFLCPMTICSGLELAILYNLKNLTWFCDKIVSFNTKSILQSDTFIHCSRDVLKRILLMNEVSCTEIDIFEACMKWTDKFETTAMEERKEMLGDIFELIRFPTMSVQQFSACLESCEGMLSSEEILDINRHITEGSHQLMVAKRFNCNKRVWKLPKWSWSSVGSKNVLYCRRHDYGSDLESDLDSDDDSEYKDLSREESLRFYSNKKIQLLGMATEKIKSRRCASHKYDLKVTFQMWLLDISGNEIIFEHCETLHTDRKNYINFGKPIFINPQCWYGIRMIFDDNVMNLYIHANIEKTKRIVDLEHGVRIKFDQPVRANDVRGSDSPLFSELLFQFDCNK